MKVGMIFECGPQGADKKVCEYLAKKINPTVEISSVTLDNKKKLTSECGRAAATLLNEGCGKIVIIWDLHPAWRNKDYPPCRKEDREEIFRSLTTSNVPIDKVMLICIEEELEAWLIADERAISIFLSSKTRAFSAKKVKKPEQRKNPKGYLTQIFVEVRGRSYKYNDLIHAEKIIRELPDLNRLQKCPSFLRFQKFVGID